MRHRIQIEGRSTEPLPWATLADDGTLTEHASLDQALHQPGVVMRRFSTLGRHQPDGTCVWAAAFIQYSRPVENPDHAVAANSSPETQRFYDDH